MWRTLGGLCLASAMLAGCSSNHAAENHRYLHFLHSNEGDFATFTDSTLLDMGRQVCVDLNAGSSLRATFDHVANNPNLADRLHYDPTGIDAGWIMGSAGTNLCPQYAPKVQSYLSGW